MSPDRTAPFDIGLLIPCPREAERWRAMVRQALQDYTLNSLRPSSLHMIIRLNVLNAIADNATLMGIPKENLCHDDYISPLHRPAPERPQNPSLALENCPSALQPTSLQRHLPHHPWIDLFPFPRFRDNVLRGIQANLFEEDDLCSELLGPDDTGPGEQPALLVWTAAWNPEGWEVNEAFLEKWGYLLAGCPEIIESTNQWRARRGQKMFSSGFCTELPE